MVLGEFMVVAGEPSGDLLAADLVRELRKEIPAANHDGSAGQPLRASLEPRFFGAGGAAMAAAGVSLLFDMTQHSVVGLSDVLKKVFTFRRLMALLVDAAVERQPQAIICVDFSGFNLRFARAIRRRVKERRGAFHNWSPKIVQFVSPQVWASRARRAKCLERDVDLLLTIFPFEREWYARHAPGLKVEFVGHPIVDRYAQLATGSGVNASHSGKREAVVAFLPGSRVGELRRHVPVMAAAARFIKGEYERVMVLPSAELARLASGLLGGGSGIRVQTGGLPEALRRAELAVAATGTVTMECAYFGVPTVAMYKTSWMTYQIGKRIIRVPYLAMPNLLAGEELFPEFVQDAATGEKLGRAASELLGDAARRAEIRVKLAKVIAGLGSPGASRRGAKAICELMEKNFVGGNNSVEGGTR
jgi:lipid-A-disaccharide synthase